MTLHSTAASPRAAGQPAGAAESAADSATVTIETRFGTVEFQRANAIYLPRGLLGYADYHDFGLAALPKPGLEQFRLMQSLTEPALSFVVAPLNMDGGPVEPADIENACAVLSVAFADVAVMVVVATRQIGNQTQISVNLRAPIIVDVPTRTAWQHVLANSRYPVRHVLSSVSQAGGGAD